jgi:lipopolysaccharide export system protein LptA
MASLKLIWTVSLACGSLLIGGRAMAQIATGSTCKDPISAVQDQLDRDDIKHVTISTGSVEADQCGARLVTDKLTIFYYGQGEGPNAQAKPAAPAGAKSGDGETSLNGVKQMVAEGHVFYVTQNETARGNRGVYDAEPDTITLSGGVIVVQGKNVMRGDKMVINRKTGLTTVVSDVTGRNNPDRVRAVIYNDNDNAPGQGAAGQAPKAQGAPGPAPKPPAAPAKKP